MALLDSALAYIPHRTTAEKRSHFHLLVRIAFLRKDQSAIHDLLSSLPGVMQPLNKKDPENKDAWTSYRVGEMLLSSGKQSSSGADSHDPLAWFENAHQLAPLDPAFANKYATMLVSARRPSEARKIWEFMVKEHPNYPPGFCNLGFLILQQEKNTRRAHELIDRSIALDPDYELALLNKASVCIQDGDWKKAAFFLNLVLKKNPGQEQAKRALSAIRSGKSM
jgi:Tfp pilus assembly protein PilF